MEQNFQHTPGPWKVCDNDYQVLDQNYHLVATAYTKDVHTEQQFANARLIAAAPELLEALQFCRSVLKNQGLFDRSEILAFQKATDAIDKATDPNPSQSIGELIPEILADIKQAEHTPETAEDARAWYAANPNE